MGKERECSQPGETLPKVIRRVEFATKDGSTGIAEVTYVKGSLGQAIADYLGTTLSVSLKDSDKVCFFSDNKITI